jgi:hypothetical protein
MRLPVTEDQHARIAYLAGRPLSLEAGAIEVSIGNTPVLLLGPLADRPTDLGWLSVKIDREMEPVAPPPEDFGAALDELRATKSADELRSIDESSWLLDQCVDRLLDSAIPGHLVRHVAADVHRHALALGASGFMMRLHRPLVVSANGVKTSMLSNDPPDDGVLRVGEPVCVSLALAGPSGYWVHLTRTIALGSLGESDEDAQRSASAALASICRYLKPGSTFDEVADIARLAALDEGGVLHAISLEGTGLARTEAPDLNHSGQRAQTGHVIRARAWSTSPCGTSMSLQADTLVVEREVSRRLTTLPIGVLHVSQKSHIGRTGTGDTAESATRTVLR